MKYEGIEYKNVNKKKIYWYLKRFFDIIFSLTLIIILFPLMLIVGILLYINLKSPIYNERRMREGLFKKSFLMYKFRTKKLNSDDLPIEERYTKFSLFIDRTHLNELPQLFNILIGDMSFIGPRPFIPDEKLPNDKISYKRYLVRPGVMGLAQINGGRFLSHKQKLSYDAIYYDNFGILQDLKILILTPIDFLRQSCGYYLKK